MALQDLEIQTDRGPLTVRAQIVGDLAVHATPGEVFGSRAWTVTHRATGRRVSFAPQKRFALAMARQLAAEVTWPEDGKVSRAHYQLARRIVRDHSNRAWISHPSL